MSAPARVLDHNWRSRCSDADTGNCVAASAVGMGVDDDGEPIAGGEEGRDPA